MIAVLYQYGVESVMEELVVHAPDRFRPVGPALVDVNDGKVVARLYLGVEADSAGKPGPFGSDVIVPPT